MFTGIINHTGEIVSIKNKKNCDMLLEVLVNKTLIDRSFKIGCSIACNGICLTLTKKKLNKKNIILSFYISQETQLATNVSKWRVGDKINLEFSLKFGDEIGGHFVLGHVDGISQVKSIKKIKDSHEISFTIPKGLKKFIAKKSSVTLNGVSLTVNKIYKNIFVVNLLQYSLEKTNFVSIKEKDFVNLEIDSVARYLYFFRNAK